MRVALLGPPGVGKGTQGRKLARDCGWPLISTGEILREAVAQGTSLGMQARRHMDAGELVPDVVMIGLMRERSAAPDAGRGFVLDGFPRTVPQAEALDQLLQERGQKLDSAVSIDAPEEELVRRLARRLECPVCKRTYGRDGVAPRDGVHCDDHPEVVLQVRADDDADTVRHRLVVYRTQTAPLVAYYRRDGRLREVPGVGPLDEVYGAVRRALGCGD